VNEIYEVRAAVEEHAVERLATSGSKRDFEELTRVHERMAESVSLRDNSRVARYDLEWHEAICRLGGNRRLHELYKKDYVSLRALILLDDRLYSPLEKTLAEHSAVLDAVYRRDAELARSLLAHHIDDSRRTVISELNKRPGKTRDS
jgi:DNA-binding GntR family transcriptional regulator